MGLKMASLIPAPLMDARELRATKGWGFGPLKAALAGTGTRTGEFIPPVTRKAASLTSASSAAASAGMPRPQPQIPIESLGYQHAGGVDPDGAGHGGLAIHRNDQRSGGDSLSLRTPDLALPHRA